MGEMPPELSVHLVDERDISPEQDAAIRALLVSAFSRESAEHFRTSSYWGPRPTHRLWLEDRDQAIVAHLDLETRTIQVGDVDVLVAGVGEVATAPGLQGSGVGRRMMAELQRVLKSEAPVSFGILQCGDQVLGFYESTGWQRIDVLVRAIHPDSGQWDTVINNVLITPGMLPISAWPEGPVDLRGLLW
jgi:aminoglycoside 2'-N-acetyltransferase I